MGEKVKAAQEDESIAKAYAAYLMALAARRQVDLAPVIPQDNQTKLQDERNVDVKVG